MYSKFKSRSLSTVPALFVCVLLAFFFGQSKASAQTCIGTGCSLLAIENCTDIEFRIKFYLCCANVVTESDIIIVPAGPCPTPITPIDFAQCTVLSVAGISPSGATVIFDPVTCTVSIF